MTSKTPPIPAVCSTTSDRLPDEKPAAHYPGLLIEPLAVDAGQAAALIGLSRSMFFKLVDAGRIGPEGVRLGKAVRYPVSELRAWAAAGMPPRHEWAARRDER